MLRAARVAAGRRLELRVVPLPAGADPADLVAAEGARAMQRLVDTSVPFVRFRVERELSTGTSRAPRARTPSSARCGRSSRRSRRARCARSSSRSSRTGTDLAPAMVGSWLAQGAGRAARPARGARRGRRTAGARARAPAAAAPPPRSLDAAARAERDYLVQCVAVPSAAAADLAALDVEAAFTDELMRRAALHLRDHADAPTDGPRPGRSARAAHGRAGRPRRARRAARRARCGARSSTSRSLAVRREKAAARAEGRPVAPIDARERELVSRANRAIEQELAESQPAT